MQDDSTTLDEVVVVGKPKAKKDNTIFWLLVACAGVGALIYLKSKPTARKVTI
jgi:hypothetical protein